MGRDTQADTEPLRAEIPLGCVSGGTHEPPLMAGHHLHHHLELNFVHSGGVTYSFLGRPKVVPVGAFIAFWAAVPHRLVSRARSTRMSWFTVPLPFIGTSELGGFLGRLFRGEIIGDLDPGPRDGEDVARWVADLSSDSRARTAAATLEIVARLVRLAASSDVAAPSHEGVEQHRRVRAMLGFIHRAYAEPIGLAEVADAAALSPDYASATFHRAMGLTPSQYLLTIRVYRACQLLVETDRGVADIALAAGFRAVSSFYDTFQRVMGIAPGELRRSIPWFEHAFSEELSGNS